MSLVPARGSRIMLVNPTIDGGPRDFVGVASAVDVVLQVVLRWACFVEPSRHPAGYTSLALPLLGGYHHIRLPKERAVKDSRCARRRCSTFG